jgi:hypothetical protein
MYLVYDLLTALLPGILFSVLLIAKHLHAPTEALSSPLLGYKIKISLGLLVSYIIGRVFRTPIELALFVLFEREMNKVSNPPHGGATTDFVRNFFIGALAVPKLFNKVQPVDMMVLLFANTIFTANTGVIFMVAGAIHGDGFLRAVELGAGLVMLLTVAAGVRRFVSSFALMMGGVVDLPALFGPLAQITNALNAVQKAANQEKAPTDPPVKTA